MAGSPKNPTKTDLRRGLFTKSKTTPPAAPAGFPGPVTAAEQDALFDLTAVDSEAKLRPERKPK